MLIYIHSKGDFVYTQLKATRNGRCLAKEIRRGHKRYTAQRNMTMMPIADYGITEGFRGDSDACEKDVQSHL